MIGQVISTYRIEQKIGEGGMGAVYRGRDLMLEREVAIKVLRPELARQPELVTRFRSEAVTLARLNHSNIATLFNFLRQGDDYFMIMEFVRGRTLEEIIRQSGALGIVEAAQIFCQALEGIERAHALGIIHRDIKPANLMLSESGEVKVMDFGIARVLGTARQTRTGRLIGTMEYMAPEQMRGQETDARADIYSLGILLYEMLTGRAPFECNSDYELMRAQVEDAPPSPREFNGDIPLPVELAILRALAKDPQARFQSANEFRAAIISAIPEAAFKPSPIPLLQEPAIKPTRLAGAENEYFSSGGDAPGMESQSGEKRAGFDSQTGTFTLRLPAFALALQQRLEASFGPLNRMHYGGAGVMLILLLIGGWAYRRGESNPLPAKRESVQPVPASVSVPSASLPAAAPPIGPTLQESATAIEASVAPDRTGAGPGDNSRPLPVKTRNATSPRPRQAPPVVAVREPLPPPANRVETARAQPTPTPEPSPEKKEKKKKWWEKAIEAGAGAAGEIIRRKN